MSNPHSPVRALSVLIGRDCVTLDIITVLHAIYKEVECNVTLCALET